MDNESEFAAARAAFGELTPESPSADFEARLRRRLAPPPASRWTLANFFALTPAFAAAAVAGFALFRLGHLPAPRVDDASPVEASAPGYDVGRWGHDPNQSPCSTALYCD